MQNDIQTLLNSTRVEDRKQAIKLLIQRGGDEAMFQLAMLYKHDPDPDVRHLAVQAGKFLKQQSAGQSSVTTQEVRAVFGTQPDNSGDVPPSRRTQEAKPPTAPTKSSTQENKPPTVSRRTQEMKPPTAPTKSSTQETKPPTWSGRATQEARPPTDARRSTQENKPPTWSSRATQETSASDLSRRTQENKPPTVSRRTQEVRPVTPPPVNDDLLDDDDVPDYEYVPVTWQDEDKARGFIAAANMMYNEAKLKAAADYLRRAVEANPNLRRDDTFITTVARLTERPKEVALQQLLNTPDKRTVTQEKPASPWGGFFGGGGGDAKKKKQTVTPGELTWKSVSLDLFGFALLVGVIGMICAMVFTQQLREPVERAIRITGQISPSAAAETRSIRTAGQLIQVMKITIDRYNLLTGIGGGLLVSASFLLSLLLDYLGIHIAATVTMLGFGSFKTLIRRMTWFEAAFFLFGGIMSFAYLYGITQSAAADLVAGAITPNQSLYAYVQRMTASQLGLQCISIFLLRFLSSFLIAGVYGFGVVRGCVTQFVSGLVQALLLAAASALLVQAFLWLLTIVG